MNANVLKAVSRWSLRIFLVCLVTLIAGAVAVVTVIPRMTHGAALTVLSGSMTPGIPVSSIVLDRPVDPGTLHVGDIATYQKEPGKAEFITHRIVAIDTKTTPVTFTFKGDANRGPDLAPVPATAIRGKVWFHVPYLGGIRDALHTKGGISVLAFAILLGYAIFQGAGFFRDRRGRSRAGDHHRGAAPSDLSHEAAIDVAPIDAQSDTTARRRIMLATFRTGLTGPLARDAVVWALEGTVVEQTDDTFTVAVVGPRASTAGMRALLATLDPLSAETFVSAESVLPERREPDDDQTEHEFPDNELAGAAAYA